MISNNTGGFPILDTNDADPGIRQVFRENGSYYLLGYASSNPRTEGRLRRIQVSVKSRPDVQVRVRSGYYEPESPRKRKDTAPVAPAWGSISGTVAKTDLVLGVTPRPMVAPGDRFAALIPIVPTTRREFTGGDEVIAFLRVYDGGRQGNGPASVTARITDGADRVVFRTTEAVALTSVGTLRVADYLLALPIERLLPGPHLLTIEATLGKDVVRRDARFDVGQ